MNHALDISCCNNQCQWYVVQCKPRKELYAANALSDLLDLVTFLPESHVYSRGEVRRVPFFPGYFFVQANLQTVQISLINTSPGVLRLLSFDGSPQSVPHVVVAEIYEEVNRLNANGGLLSRDFSPGDLVRVKNGPLQGLETIFAGPTTSGKRVRVLLHLLGRLKEVQIEPDSLEKIPSPPTPQRKRLTRGKGRRIKTYSEVC